MSTCNTLGDLKTLKISPFPIACHVMKRILILIAKIVVIVILFIFLFKSNRLTKEQVAEIYKTRNVIFFAISGIAFFSAQFLAAVRLRILLKTTDVSVCLKKCFQLTMIGSFFSMIMLGMTGGDIVKGYYLLNEETNDKGRSSAVIVMDRVIGLFSAIFLTSIFIVYMLYYHLTTSIAGHNGLFITFAAILGSLLCLLTGLLFLGTNQRAREKLRQFWFARLSRNFMYRMAEGFVGILRHRQALLLVFLISVAIQLLSLVSVLVFGMLISESLPPLVVQAAVSSVVFITGSIPVTPGNIGWTELVGAFGWAAVGSSAGGAIFLYRRFTNILCSLPGGLFYVSLNYENRQIQKVDNS